MTDFCILCANGNDLPEGECCRGCGRAGRSIGLGAAVITAKCAHIEVAFHSGGHYIQCKTCLAWWIATKNAHTHNECVDYDRGAHSAVTVDAI